MRVMAGLAAAALCIGLTACSGSGTSGPVVCSTPPVPVSYLAYPAPNSTGIVPTNVSVYFGVSAPPGRNWSVALVSNGATIAGSTLTVVTSLPAGSAPLPSWEAQDTVTDYVSAMPALLPATTYRVDVTITFGPPGGACPNSSTSAIGSFTTS